MFSSQTTPINCCTYNTTSNEFNQQYWKRCYTCWPTTPNSKPDEGEKGACIQCISVCHEGHTVDAQVRFGNFFCDCGWENKICKLSSGTPTLPGVIRPTPIDRDERRNIFPYPHPIPSPTPFFPPQQPNERFPFQPMNIPPPCQMQQSQPQPSSRSAHPQPPSAVMGGNNSPPGSF